MEEYVPSQNLQDLPKNSSIVDSPCSSISLASRLSHKKKLSPPNESF